MKKVWAKDVQPPMMVSEAFLISDLSIRDAKNKTKFATFKASDKTGTIDCIMFGFGMDEPNNSSLVKNGEILVLSGSVSKYNDKVNFQVTNVGLAGMYPRSEFEKASEYDPEDMWNELMNHYNDFQDNWFKLVAGELLKSDDVEKFKVSPAATGVHHAFKSGLIEHTTQMLILSKNILSLPFMHKDLNRDLCMFGIMFHDFGKIYEYSTQAGFKRTVQGVLVPHIPMVAARILEAANKHGVPEMVRDHMMHVVLAHHRRLEWGSPVTFSCPEAAFVHYIDNLHGDVFGIIQKRAEAKEETIKYGFGADTCNIIAKPFNMVLKEAREALNEVQLPPTPSREKTIVDGF